ncbi:hypothetical protein I5M32_03265 [Pedobacter sp. SD-b]|uniref:Outer membrane protein beta-barrel domain-containing protein n=1 Tax=Pedobacter segetis TaxID=2793069 RepID=A0ABS1BGH1_9SPHI|nr:hypothetical protein [Pedobacter segetis]MBK0381968.1 hypothetical protein [Pedobacter segetis]
MTQKSILKTIISIFLLTFGKSSAKAQNHFYAEIKYPFLELIIDYANQDNNKPEYLKKHEPKDSAGFILSGGYAAKMYRDFYIETGVNYHVLNQTIDKERNTGNTLTIRNYVFGTQIRPAFKKVISMDKDVFLNVGLGIDYQRMYSNGDYHRYFVDANGFNSSDLQNNKSKSNYFLNLRPYLGIDFKKVEKVGFRVGFTFEHQNYDRTNKALKFSNDGNLVIPKKESDNLLLSVGMIF